MIAQKCILSKIDSFKIISVHLLIKNDSKIVFWWYSTSDRAFALMYFYCVYSNLLTNASKLIESGLTKFLVCCMNP